MPEASTVGAGFFATPFRSDRVYQTGSVNVAAVIVRMVPAVGEFGRVLKSILMHSGKNRISFIVPIEPVRQSLLLPGLL